LAKAIEATMFEVFGIIDLITENEIRFFSRQMLFPIGHLRKWQVLLFKVDQVFSYLAISIFG